MALFSAIPCFGNRFLPVASAVNSTFSGICISSISKWILLGCFSNTLLSVFWMLWPAPVLSGKWCTHGVFFLLDQDTSESIIKSQLCFKSSYGVRNTAEYFFEKISVSSLEERLQRRHFFMNFRQILFSKLFLFKCRWTMMQKLFAVFWKADFSSRSANRKQSIYFDLALSPYIRWFNFNDRW